MTNVIGLDLAGKPENDTGFCILKIGVDGKIATETKLLKTDEEILAAVEAAQPALIAVDAPFFFPDQKEGYFRKPDRLLQEHGYKPLSPLFRGMQPLVRRAMFLVDQLRNRGFKVVETFPQAIEKILGTPMSHGANKDEYDALLCALAAKAHLEGKSFSLEGIVLPKAR